MDAREAAIRAAQEELLKRWLVTKGINPEEAMRGKRWPNLSAPFCRRGHPLTKAATRCLACSREHPRGRPRTVAV